ncbi:hypothetical protein Moror_11697 [Moniliophthora roreri MCA 2997]|uniref:Uncharacterized protein n=2 Tax=Moniliophthora roreri TaxID=221103 RepID=A0A0W0G7Z3_MONRR|nr:hypothetical protein Moror_11697 [Moniliophthora roreri MCA 2997]
MSNSSVTEEDIAPFNSITTILVQPMVNLTVMLYVYALFILTTIINIITTFSEARQATLEFTFTKNWDWASFLAYLEHDNVKTIIFGLGSSLPLCLVIMADLMLLHHCYVIWGSSKWIALPIVFIMVSLAICDVVASILGTIGVNNFADPAKVQLYLQGGKIDQAFWLANMGVNITLTLLTAGRIWWISHEAQKHLGPAIKTKYNTIVAIILESGIIYPIFLTANVINEALTNPDGTGLSIFSLWVVVYQIAGIAPTLIIIQAARGKTIEYTSMGKVISSLHFADGAGPESGNLDTRSHVQMIDIEASLPAEETGNPGEERAA